MDWVQKWKKAAAFFVVLVVTACSSGPEAINYGSDQCAHCRMVITEKPFASELVTNKGKVYKFDAIECLAAYLDEHEDLAKNRSTRYVHDFANPDKWIKADQALFVQSEEIQSPMALSLLAFSSAEVLETHLRKYQGSRISWSEIVEQVRNKW